MSIDRRKHLRASISISVSYWSDGKEPVQSFTQTIGAGGLFIETAVPLALETSLKIEFCIPGEPQKTKVHGKVVWIRARFVQDASPGMGIQFVGITRSEREKIQALVLKVLKGTE
ncbi:MAG: PilZ domain-containing protein [Nitrospirae bacterium]|nr:PilZ domain-containing protein [Nitrospirota bacterium]